MRQNAAYFFIHCNHRVLRPVYNRHMQRVHNICVSIANARRFSSTVANIFPTDEHLCICLFYKKLFFLKFQQNAFYFFIHCNHRVLRLPLPDAQRTHSVFRTCDVFQWQFPKILFSAVLPETIPGINHMQHFSGNIHVAPRSKSSVTFRELVLSIRRTLNLFLADKPRAGWASRLSLVCRRTLNLFLADKPRAGWASRLSLVCLANAQLVSRR